MTSLQRFESVFSGEAISEIPVALCYEEIAIRDHFDDISDMPGEYFNDSDIEKRILWHKGVKKRLSHDWVRFPFAYCVEDEDEAKLQEKPVRGGQDFTEEWNEIQNKGNKIDSKEQIDRLVSVMEDGKETSGGPLTERLKTLYNDRPLTALMSMPFWKCSYLWKFEDLMTMTLEAPALLEYAEKCFMDRSIKLLDHLGKQGVNMVWIEDCYTDMLSPQLFERFNTVFAEGIINSIQSLGMKCVYYYTGNTDGKLDALLSLRADAYAFEESKKTFDNDVTALARKIKGESVLVGNIDSIGVLQDGDMQSIRQEIRRQVEAGRRNEGRFVVGLGSPITPDTPTDKIIEFIKIAREETIL